MYEKKCKEKRYFLVWAIIDYTNWAMKKHDVCINSTDEKKQR